MSVTASVCCCPSVRYLLPDRLRYGNMNGTMLSHLVRGKVYKESELIAIYFHMKSKQISCCLPIVVVTKLGKLQLICFDFIWK